jgi:hypothetical protein
MNVYIIPVQGEIYRLEIHFLDFNQDLYMTTNYPLPCSTTWDLNKSLILLINIQLEIIDKLKLEDYFNNVNFFTEIHYFFFLFS